MMERSWTRRIARVPASSSTWIGFALAMAWILFPLAANAAPPGAPPSPPAAPVSASSTSHVRFERNLGQSDPRVDVLARGSGYWLFLTPDAAVIALESSAPEPADKRPVSIDTTVLRMEWVGAAPAPRIVTREELPGRSHYLLGSTPDSWHTNVPAYGRARYQGVYPGVDLDFYTDQGRLEYDFVVAPGADPGAVRLRFDGSSGMEVDGHGDLVLHTATGDVVQRAPTIYQEIGTERRTVSGRYVLVGDDQVGFEVGAYDPRHPLVIDPVMVFSTFLGGADLDIAYGAAVDGDGSIYLTGWDGSIDFPTTTGSYQASPTGGFVTKLAADGHGILYSAVLPTVGEDVAIDSQGHAWVVSAYNGLAGAVYELDATGSSLLASRQLNGGGATGIAVDSADDAYVVGTAPIDFTPTAGAFQTTPGVVAPRAFVMKLDATGAVVYASYLGNGGDSAEAVAVDAAGVAYVTGYTFSASFPTRSAFQPDPAGSYDAFVTAIDPTGGSLVYSTYLGGTGGDFAEDVAVDAGGSAYVTGRTSSWDFPLATPFQATLGGGEDAFVAKLAPDGRSLAYSTYLGGGSGGDEAYAIALDGADDAVVVGRTAATDLPVVNAPQPTFDGSRDAFAAKLDATGGGLVWATYLGGSLSDEGWAVAVDGTGDTVVAGSTNSFDFPTASPLQPTHHSVTLGDAFVAKISETAAAGPLADVVVALADSADPVAGGAPFDYTVSYTNVGPDAASGVASLIRLDPFETFRAVTASQGACTGPNATNWITCDLGLLAAGSSATVTVGVNAPSVDGGAIGSDVFVTADEWDPALWSDADRETTLITAGGLSFTLSVAVTGSGTVASTNLAGIACPTDCTEIYPDGQGVILSATPANGWQLDHWAGDCAGTGDCNLTMTADHSVSAVFVESSPTPPPPTTDTVHITLAEYDARKGQLQIQADSTDPSATLQAFVTSTGELIGTLSPKGNGGYRARFNWPTNPGNVTVKSSSGGSNSVDVTLK